MKAVTLPSGERVWLPDSAGAAPRTRGEDYVPRAEAAALPKHQVIDEYGRVYETTANALLPGRGALYEATPEDVRAARDGPRTSAVEAFGTSVARGAFDAATAIPRLATGAGAALLGGEDPLEHVSGAELLAGVAGLTGGAFGDRSMEYYTRKMRERLALLDAEHSIASGAGRLYGELPFLVAGGIGRKGVSMLAAEAVMGAASSGTAAQEHAYVRDVPLAAEQYLATVGVGGLVGAGLAGVGAGAGRLFRAARASFATPAAAVATREGAEVAAEAALREGAEAAAGAAPREIDRFAAARAVKAAGATAGQLQKVSAERQYQIGRAILDATHDDGAPVLRAFDTVDDTAARLSAAVRRAGEDVGAARRAAFAAADAAGEGFEAKRLWQEIQDDVLTPLEKSMYAPTRRQAKRVRSAFAALEKAAADDARVSYDTLWDLRRDVDAELFPAKGGRTGLVVAKSSDQHVLATRGIIEREVERAVEKHGDVAAYRAAKARFGALADAEKLAGRRSAMESGNRYVSPSDYAIGGAVAMQEMISAGEVTAASGLGGVVASLVHRELRRKGSSTLAVLADRAARGAKRRPATADFARAFGGDTPTGEAAAVAGAPDAAAVVAALEKRTAERIDGGLVSYLGRAPRAPRSAWQAGRAELPRAARMAATSATANAFARRREDSQDAYRRRAIALGELRSLDQRLAFAQELVAPLASAGAHETAAVTAQRAAVALDHLYDALPERLNPQGLQPQLNPPQAEPEELRRFSEVWRAVTDPLATLGDLGAVTDAQVAAIREVYPRLYAELQHRAIDYTTSSQRPLTYEQRSQLDRVFGLGGGAEPSLAPGFLRRQAARGAAQAAPPAPTPSARSPVRGAESYATTSTSMRI